MQQDWKVFSRSDPALRREAPLAAHSVDEHR